MSTLVADVEANCAICGAPPYPECPHEGQRLEMALNQAVERWAGMQAIREWVLNHARDQILLTFTALKTTRRAQHLSYLQSLPCFALYQKYHGNPPVNPSQLDLLRSQLNNAQAIYKAGVDEDWRRSCLRYPEVLDYYFSLIEISWPDDRESVIREPRFGIPLKEVRKIKGRRGSKGSDDFGNGVRKKERRKGSRGRTPGR